MQKLGKATGVQLCPLKLIKSYADTQSIAFYSTFVTKYEIGEFQNMAIFTVCKSNC